MLDDYERYFVVSLPRTDHFAERVNGSSKLEEGPFRTQIALKLRELFGSDIFTLEEALTVTKKEKEDENENKNGSRDEFILSYKIAVKSPKAPEFLKKIEKLGKKEKINLSIREIAISDTRRKAGSVTGNPVDSDSKSDGNIE